ncbi:oxamate carbamoyltransferase subunit AllH family protein [Paraburkholderia oxyphila]|uniref:oxamate carbamoyltransferase subunit AllH family protein n=1 Tax=Paraburkholderia oxyphila TaxID=614212 RepID=UPI00048A0BF8|nr:DUF2877 domain-containing protein [Paraburkholderia oxyphila]
MSTLATRAAPAARPWTEASGPVVQIGPILRIGYKAHAALSRSGGVATAMPGSAPCGYLLAAGELIWAGTGAHALHPRAVLLAAQAGNAALASRLPLRFDPQGQCPWHPPSPQAPCRDVAALREAGLVLLAQAARLDSPRGFGRLLSGVALEFPLDLGMPHVRRLARALTDRDIHQVCEASARLLGVGPGLTPSGDDFVGAALFARRVLCGDMQEASGQLAAQARLASHPIGAALFGDLLEGRSFARLHRLADAVHAYACGSARDGLDMALAAHELTAIGSSSGWDMLSGFITAITGSLPGIQ